MKFVISVALLGLLFSSPVFAQDPSSGCNAVLTAEAYDRDSLSVNSTIMIAKKDDICSREYRDIGEAQKSARSGGFSIDYGPISIGGSSSKQKANGSWDISETAFCRATAYDLQTAYSSNYSSQVARIAVSAWLSCVESSNENQLFMDYSVSKDGQRFTGTLRTTANRGSLERKITGIGVVGPASHTVQCNIGGKTYPTNDKLRDPIGMKATSTSISCSKSGDEGVDVAFQTDQGSVPFVKLPSKTELKISQFEILEEQINLIRTKEFSDLKIQLESAFGQISKLEAVTMYQCPVDLTHTQPVAWATFGCVGQISTSPTCQNFSMVSVPAPAHGSFVTVNCSPVTMYRARQN